MAAVELQIKAFDHFVSTLDRLQIWAAVRILIANCSKRYFAPLKFQFDRIDFMCLSVFANQTNPWAVLIKVDLASLVILWPQEVVSQLDPSFASGIR